MQKDQLKEKNDLQVYKAYGKLLNYSAFLSLLWLLTAYFLFPWLLAIYPIAPLFLGLESAREAHHLSRPTKMERWQKNLVFATAGTALILTMLFVGAGVLPTLTPFLPFFLIGLIAVNTLHLASTWAKTLYHYFSTDKAERTPRMKLELAKSSVSLLFQAGTLAAITCAILLATPFVQIVAAAAIAGAILLLVGARLFSSYKMAKIQKNELLQLNKKEEQTSTPKPKPEQRNAPAHSNPLLKRAKKGPEQPANAAVEARPKTRIHREIDPGPPLFSKELDIPELRALQEDESHSVKATKRHSEPGPLSSNRYQFNNDKRSASTPPEPDYSSSSNLS